MYRLTASSSPLQFIEYAVKIPSTYDTYDEEGAFPASAAALAASGLTHFVVGWASRCADSWPSILDEFTEYAGARRKKEGDSMDLS